MSATSLGTPSRATAPTAGPTPVRTRMSVGRWARELGWRHLVGVIGVLYAAFPLVYVVSASLSEGGTLTGSNQLFAEVSGANYAALSDTRFWTWAGNSLLIAVITFVLLVRTFRSVLLPLKAVVLNLISLAAVVGVAAVHSRHRQ